MESEEEASLGREQKDAMTVNSDIHTKDRQEEKERTLNPKVDSQT